VVLNESNFFRFFTARRSYASAVLGVVILSVRLSVCLSLSHVCFVTNPKNLSAIFLYHMKGQSLCFSGAKDLGEIPTGSSQRGRQIQVGSVKTAIFDQYLAISHKRCKIGT